MLLSNPLFLLPILLGQLVRADDSVSSADIASITSFQATNFRTTYGSTCACTILTGLFLGKVLFPGSTAYTNESTHYWDMRADLAPKCIFVPTTANDVAKGVVVLNVCKSQFAIRGGGHMPVARAANNDGGVLIALSAFTSISLSADKTSVSAGPGLNWYQIYSYLDPYGLIVIGGRLKTIGIADLTIGGGISYFAAKHRFGIDNVLAYKVILANSSVATASATSNTDLFWAMKGTGSNFGIVTKFTFGTYEVPSDCTAAIVYPETFGRYRTSWYLHNSIYTINWCYQPNIPRCTGKHTIQPAVFHNFTAIPNYYSSYNVTTHTCVLVVYN